MRELKIQEKFTNRSNLVNIYFKEVNAHPKVSVQEEVELGKRIQEGDLAALNRLVEANLRFVVSVAKQYAYEDGILMELIAQGNLGLIEAARNFDPTAGFKFISYAVWHIRKEILLYYNSLHKTVNLPVGTEIDLRQIRRIEDVLEMKLERPPTADEIMEELRATGKKISEDTLSLRLKSEVTISPLDSKDHAEGLALIERLGKEDPQISQLEKDDLILLETLLGALNPTEREIVEKVMGLGGNSPVSFVTLHEGSDRSKNWAREVYKKAMLKMKIKHKQLTEKNGKEI